MKTCSICVRGGSKGVVNKNIKQIAGKPLLHHTLLQALETKLFDAICVSSDSEQILDVASQIPGIYLLKRPAEMATDTAPKMPAIRHCFQEMDQKLGGKVKIAVDLDATSPLRTIEDIVCSVRLLEENPQCSNVITGMPSRKSPYFNLVEQMPNGFVKISKETTPPITRRQDAPKCYDMNASIYVWRREVLLTSDKVLLPNTMLYEMPEERSFDIDTELDFKIVEMLLNERNIQ